MAGKKTLAIYGTGGLGLEIAAMIEKINASERVAENQKWNLIGFFDDSEETGTQISHFGPVLGGIDRLNSWPDPLGIMLCFGTPKTLETVRNKIKNPLVSFPNLIDPTVGLDDPASLTIGMGNIIKARTGMTVNVKIGNFNVFNGNVIVGHDTEIGDFNVLMWGVHVSGEVKIGNRNLFGTYSFIKQQLKIGDDITLSPLSALLTKPKEGNMYIGNPAKIFKF